MKAKPYELNIPFGERAADAFHEAHERTYGHAIRWRPVEIVNIRVNGSGANEKPSFESAETRAYEASPVGEKTSPVGGRIKMFQRADLGPGARFSGEAARLPNGQHDLCAAGLERPGRRHAEFAADARLSPSRWRPSLQSRPPC